MVELAIFTGAVGLATMGSYLLLRWMIDNFKLPHD